MILQLQWFTTMGFIAWRPYPFCFTENLDVILHQHPIVQHRNGRAFHHLLVFPELRPVKNDVVSLPLAGTVQRVFSDTP